MLIAQIYWLLYDAIKYFDITDDNKVIDDHDVINYYDFIYFAMALHAKPILYLVS